MREGTVQEFVLSVSYRRAVISYCHLLLISVKSHFFIPAYSLQSDRRRKKVRSV